MSAHYKLHIVSCHDIRYWDLVHVSDMITIRIFAIPVTKKSTSCKKLVYETPCTMTQKWNAQWKKLCRLFCLSELAVLILIFYSYNSVSDLRFSLVVEQCNSKQLCCRKTIEMTQFFSLSISLLYHSEQLVSIVMTINVH